MKRFKDFINEGLRDAMKPKPNEDIINKLEMASIPLSFIKEDVVRIVTDFFKQNKLDITEYSVINGSSLASDNQRAAHDFLYNLIDDDYFNVKYSTKTKVDLDNFDTIVIYYIKKMDFVSVYNQLGDIILIFYKMDNVKKILNNEPVNEGLRDAMKPKSNDDIISTLKQIHTPIESFDDNVKEPIKKFFNDIGLEIDDYYLINMYDNVHKYSLIGAASEFMNGLFDIFDKNNISSGDIKIEGSSNIISLIYFKSVDIIELSDTAGEVCMLFYKNK